MKQRYSIKVVEVNEIAGELVRSLATAHQSSTLTAAREWAEQRWNGQPPAGTKIVSSNGDIYDLPFRILG